MFLSHVMFLCVCLSFSFTLSNQFYKKHQKTYSPVRIKNRVYPKFPDIAVTLYIEYIHVEDGGYLWGKEPTTSKFHIRSHRNCLMWRRTRLTSQ